MPQGKGVGKGKKAKSEGGLKKKMGRTKKGLKKQVKSKEIVSFYKLDNAMS